MANFVAVFSRYLDEAYHEGFSDGVGSLLQFREAADIGNGLDAFIGTWKRKEADAFDRCIEEALESIDELLIGYEALDSVDANSHGSATD